MPTVPATAPPVIDGTMGESHRKECRRQTVTLSGTGSDLKWRAFYSLAGLRSLNYDEITVRKA